MSRKAMLPIVVVLALILTVSGCATHNNGGSRECRLYWSVVETGHGGYGVWFDPIESDIQMALARQNHPHLSHTLECRY